MTEVETVLETLRTTFRASMQTRLTAIAAEKADGVSLTAPTTNEYYINEILALDQLPAMQFIPDTSDVLIPGKEYNEDDHSIIIVAHVAAWEGDTNICAKRSYRFARAIREILLANPTLGDTVIRCYATNVDYKPMMRDGNTLKQEIWVRIKVLTHET